MLRGKGCLDRAQPFFDVVVNALQDDDGVIEALPDRELNQPRKSATSEADAAIPRLKTHSRTPREALLLSGANVGAAIACLKCILFTATCSQ